MIRESGWDIFYRLRLRARLCLVNSSVETKQSPALSLRPDETLTNSYYSYPQTKTPESWHITHFAPPFTEREGNPYPYRALFQSGFGVISHDSGRAVGTFFVGSALMAQWPLAKSDPMAIEPSGLRIV